MKALRAAVVGVGYLGNFHAQKYQALEGVDLACLVETNDERRRAVEEKYGVPAFEDYRDILSMVDLVSIVVPPEHHFEVARACIDAGVHVLVEKPVTETVSEAEQLIKAASACDLVFQVGHLERFNPGVIALRERVSDPRFIKAERFAPYKARGTEVNVVLDLMIHDIDIALSLVEGEVESVTASGRSVVTGDIDIAHARLVFDTGCIAELAASRASQDQVRAMTIQQPGAYVSIDYLNHEMLLGETDAQGMKSQHKEPAFVTKTKRGTDILMEEIKSFVSAVTNGHAPHVTGEDGKRALEIAIDVSRAIYSGETVKAPAGWQAELG